MIIYPLNWNEIGRPIQIKNLENMILKILSEIDCNCLAFSGGLDSSLMLYFMLKKYRRVRAFTIGLSENHPDVKYSRLVVKELMEERKDSKIEHEVYIPDPEAIAIFTGETEERAGDVAVRMFYNFVKDYTKEIISCDGIDEFMCGYYSHQRNLSMKTYYKHLGELQDKMLIPLDKNSGKVNVHLPYLDGRLLLFLSQIPLNKKVDKRQRKKLMAKMAQNKIPDEIINRWKYGFCDALKIKENKSQK